jgi:hypothetical protein
MYDQKTRHDLFTGGAIASRTKYSKFSQNRPDWGKANARLRPWQSCWRTR